MKKLITLLFVCVFSLWVFLRPACVFAAAKIAPKVYDSAIEAQKDFQAAVNSKSKDSLLKIFGSDAENLIFSGDLVEDDARLEEVASLMSQKYEIVHEGSSKALLHAGKNDWVFPIPIIEKDGKWSFNVNLGKEEILNRRIGENEINAIKVSNFFVNAQKLYFSEDRDGDGIKEYAQKILSTEGKKDGLYWKPVEGEAVSPFQPVVSQALSEGYGKVQSTPAVYQGYRYKILKSQTNAAKSGAINYINKKGDMTGGFALLAYPANWGTTGIMSFIVNQDGIVYEADQGKDTAKVVESINSFSPDGKWKAIKVP
jgi:hypothetical protein